MAANAGRGEVLSLYKQLIRESKKFPSYNFKNYALRRVRDAFKERKDLKEPEVITEQLKEGKKNLEILKRQVIIGKLYATEKLVVEANKKKG